MIPPKTGPAGLFPEELCETFELKPAFRGRQLFKALQEGISDWESITTLPRSLREHLASRTPLISGKIESEESSADGSAKALVRFPDGRGVEAVMLTDERERKTLCLSSQVGCAMGCSFCRTGTMGLLRNLTASEIMEQYYLMKHRHGIINNIVFMGMGEPLANIEAVKRSISLLNNPAGPGIGIRKITVSTCGLKEGIEYLSEGPLYPRMAFSLVSADQELRERLMPVTKKHPLKELKAALIDYHQKSGRRISLECVLLGGINANRKEAKRVIAFASGYPVLVNIIPWNPDPSLDFVTPSAEEIDEYRRTLENAGIPVSRRYRRGADIHGACGQLATESQ
jgi:23S rRNA (adenine2503-C2)-methyltransferase